MENITVEAEQDTGKLLAMNGNDNPAAVRSHPPLYKTCLPLLMADINNDGTPDAYWDNNLTLRRMDDNNRVDNPRYQRSWNWGGIIYWAVREGTGTDRMAGAVSQTDKVYFYIIDAAEIHGIYYVDLQRDRTRCLPGYTEPSA